MAGKLVAVTGATGFIASHLVKDLLERGYTVRGTVRNPDDLSKVQHLLELPGAKERLTLYKADLMDEGSFDKAVYGVDGVFHTASPVIVNNVTDPEAQLLDPAVKGTLSLLQAAAQAKSVKRVVLTSSTSAMLMTSRPRTQDTVIDDTWWSDEEHCREQKAWYSLSKTLAEKAAWEFVMDKHFDLVVINPTLVIGPLLGPNIDSGSRVFLNFLTGTAKVYNNMVCGFVHVKDVSLGHILAYEKAEAEGRYHLVESVLHFRQVVQKIHDLYPQYPVPTEPAYEPSQEMPIYRVDVEKAKKLGVKFQPFEIQVTDAVASLKQRGLLETLKNCINAT